MILHKFLFFENEDEYEDDDELNPKAIYAFFSLPLSSIQHQLIPKSLNS
jgi:hypothetical protein